MRFIDIHIDGFGKFHDLSIRFDEGMNIIYGHNEAGKSTLHAFLQAMLYGLRRRPGHTGNRDPEIKYAPWDDPERFGGTLRMEYEGSIYRITRNFHPETKSLTIQNETTHTAVQDPEGFLHTVLGGISETAFENTVSIGQLHAATSRGMVSELKTFIKNLNSTGDMSLSSEGAMEYLREQKGKFQEKLVPEAAKTYTALIGEIRNIEREIARPEYENQLRKYEDLRSDTRTRHVDRQTRKEELLQKIASQETTLQQSGLPNDEAIAETAAHAESIYATYCLEKQRNERAGRIVLPVLAFVFAVLSLVAVVLSAAAGSPEFAAMLNLAPEKVPGLTSIVTAATAPTIVAVLTFLVFVFLLSGVLLVVRNVRNGKTLVASGKELNDLLIRHTGSGEIDEEAMKHLEQHFNELKNVYHTLTDNKAALQDLNEEIQNLSDEERKYDVELQKQNEKQNELEGKLEHLANVKNRAEMLRRTLSENDQIGEEIDAIHLAMEIMTDLQKNIKESFGHYLNKEAGQLISGITGGVYDSMWIDQNLDIYMNTPSKLVPIDDVSSGTMDQIYLALRLAASKLMQTSVSDKLPLIFDDSFAMYDEQRLTSSLEFITEIHEGQILLFTCHTRERRLLDQAEHTYQLIEL